MDDHLRSLAMNAKAWAFEEAKKVLKRVEKTPPKKGYVLFETGYGPSGLPHIGTFGEVARTTMVRHAFETLSDIPTKLIAFSDDMDGLRKVPDNVPNKDLLTPHLGKSLTAVPDPFETHESFGHHNNARLRSFLDEFGFDYDFKSSTELYKNGTFDTALLNVLAHYDLIMKAMLATLREERRATYSPFLPVCPETGEVLQVPTLELNTDAGTIVYENPQGKKVETLVTGGHCKLQWKADWAMRWVALDVDYEMSGKDLIDSVSAANQIARILGSTPPEGFNYELFLDEHGKKISKSKGNGLSMEDWLRYGPAESLSYYNFQKPKRAKRLHFDIIPKCVDEYISFVRKFPEETPEKQLENPAWHIHSGDVPSIKSSLSFSILLNLASVCNTDDVSVLWGFISRYVPDATPESAPMLNRLVQHAAHYYVDFIKPHKQYRAPDATERAALEELKAKLKTLPLDTEANDLQTEVFTVGKNHNYENLREWFKALYEVLLGQTEGPRMGSFIALYGIKESIALIDKVLKGDDLSGE